MIPGTVRNVRDAPLRIGLACTGWAAQWAVHDPIRSGVSATVVFVASRSRERAAAHALRHAVPAWGSWADLLARADVECVYVAAPNSAHAALVREALAAGKHVLCEKPVTRSGTVADELCDYARAHGLVLWEGMHYRRHPAVLEAVSTLRAGAVGRPRRVDVFYGWPLDRPEDIRWAPDLHGGALMDVGCYGLDLAAWILDEPLTVFDVEWAPSASGVDATAVVRLAGATTEAVIGAGLTSPELICRATVFGDGGHAVLERPCLPVLPDGERRCAFEMVVNGERPGQGGDSTTSYYYQLHAFVRAIRGAREPLVDPDLSGRAWLLQQAWQRIGEACPSARAGETRAGEGGNEQSM